MKCRMTEVKFLSKISVIFFLSLCLFPAFCQGQVFKGFAKLKDQVNISLTEGTLGIHPLTENAVRIKFYKEPEPGDSELVFISNISFPLFQVTDFSSTIEIKMKKIMVVLDKQTGRLSFSDNSGYNFSCSSGER